MHEIDSIREIKNLKGKRVLLRLDLNVPIEDGVILNDFRIKKSLPTINFLKEGGAKTIIITHLWGDESKTLKPVYERLSEDIKLHFIESNIGEESRRAVEEMEDGEIILLENLRLGVGEKENDRDFAKELSLLGDIYVNDAFSVSHRKHASVVSLPKLLPSYSGFLFEEEINNLSKALAPPKPFLFILGGAKFETKIPLIIKYLDRADYVYTAGALANDFFKAKGFEIGKSKWSGENYDVEKYLDRENLYLPKDVTVQNDGEISVKKPSDVEADDKILDVGLESIADLKNLIKESEFILWNGPLGDYENGFRDGTIDLAKAIAESSSHSIIGGGDTFAVISKLNLEDKFDFISTAGGALLEFLYSGTLPGIEALKKGDSKSDS
jgi:phosphoglycerate kinase